MATRPFPRSHFEDGLCFLHPTDAVLRGDPRRVRSKHRLLLIWACCAPFQHPREDRPERQGLQVLVCDCLYDYEGR